jgi:hypothetical protein
MGAGGMTAALVVATNRISSLAEARVTWNGAQPVALDARGGNVEVTAKDRAAIVASTALYSAVSPTNDAGAGVLNRFVGAFLDDYRYTSSSGVRALTLGDKVRAADGTVYAYMGVDGVQRDLADAVQQYADDKALWKPLSATNLLNDALQYAALTSLGAVLKKELTGSASAVFGIASFNDVRSGAVAAIDRAAVKATGSVAVRADEASSITATDASHVVPWEGKGAIIVTNNLLASADASVQDSTLGTVPAPVGGVLVEAVSEAELTASATSILEGFDKVIGFVLAFNAIGWRTQNLLFNAVDALLGDPVLAAAYHKDDTPSAARARLLDTTVRTSGDVVVRASQRAQLDGTVGNEGTADAALDGVLFKGASTGGLAGGGAVAMNKVKTLAEATIVFTTTARGVVSAAGQVLVEAVDSAALTSRSTVVQTANVSNTAAGLASAADALVDKDYEFTTASGVRTVRKGDQVRVASGYDATKGDAGGIYTYTGTAPALLDLGATNFKQAGGPWTRSTRCPTRAPTTRSSATSSSPTPARSGSSSSSTTCARPPSRRSTTRRSWPGRWWSGPTRPLSCSPS